MIKFLNTEKLLKLIMWVNFIIKSTTKITVKVHFYIRDSKLKNKIMIGLWKMRDQKIF